MHQPERPEVVRQLNELGQLSAGVGHHVINAFSAIVSSAELLRLGDSPRPVDPLMLADTIVRTAIDASGVARRLIDYSRTATAPGDARVALDQIAARVVENYRQRSNPSMEWSTELARVPPIRGNEAQLAAMLDHLIRNSLEAMPASGGMVSLKTSVDNRGWVVLEVRDTGVGMPAQVQERAVEPFFTTRSGHIGVGLSIANGIWRRHRGTLALQSQPGEGSRVRLCVESERSPGSP